METWLFFNELRRGHGKKQKNRRKGDLSDEELKKRQSNGGKRSGEVRRAKRDARESARYILGLAAQGTTLEQLEKIGANREDNLTNMEVLQARLFVQATSGDMTAAKMLLSIAGYDSEENRKERESINADRRRDAEVEVKVKAFGMNPDNIAVNGENEDGNNDVVIYIPKMLTEEECQVQDDENE